LAIARENGAALGARVEWLEGDLDGPVAAGERFDVIVSNPPYVPAGEIEGLAREVKREPRMALDGGADGLVVLRRIVGCAPSRLHREGLLVMEMHESHEASLPALCRAAGFASAAVHRDLAGLPRWVVARLPPPA
ncbi:MAG TPA: peptide chain release factor N(5)-glutamine methyltransferase, partial [Anaeromyxobacteraceae bacterium]|nr:peptide chain release factor N(5)-glutamine methyltransferase [Anaeromyxobacteraceae bacterium]